MTRIVCGHKCKVGEKYVLPQAQAFGLSWSNAKGRYYSPGCTGKCNQDITGWPSPGPTGKMMHDKGPVQVPAQAQVLEWMLGLDERTLLPA